ncbi:uncharacterized protein LOC131044744 isoform X2 [Cryptomeria japonica]|uniref:uncharacterized protein LOC131044744 isoform X2 n=1 Tax=Cryptomeria japonica TaxID=3369 RepID=UPI0025AB89A6|nr:uncharacterized protein LOC131044744 isoform X2 [Cryptomeria japonica]XP_057834138.1 uncharacterized protein LOC131044744 isoform X2 [Cryptomeria japonica]XP_057834139.1 uncharacterized protein LOC131044744 isoform X2 [Cryptomeria japonica]XP_057834140.1 uncharacterized protein LOC131044744 isoform X2 [Cryptomeria japonica]XP_057834141.1 uncharacterized protein LOC131044744 isoform X2 [Cryptomeria japonica]
MMEIRITASWVHCGGCGFPCLAFISSLEIILNQKEVMGLRKKLENCKDSRKQLEAEVRFLRSRKRMLTSKKLLDLIDPEASPNDHLKIMCKNRSNGASIEGLPIEHEPITHGSHPWLQLYKSQHISSVPETTAGVQSSNLARQQTPSVTAIREPVLKKRRLQSNDTLNSSEPKGSKKKKLQEKGKQKPNPRTDEGSDNRFWDKK